MFVQDGLAVPLFVRVASAFHRCLPDLGAGHCHAGPVFWLAVILGHRVSFAITYAFGLLALWLYETRSLFNFYSLPLIIFSALLPPCCRPAAALLPPCCRPAAARLAGVRPVDPVPVHARVSGQHLPG